MEVNLDFDKSDLHPRVPGAQNNASHNSEIYFRLQKGKTS